MGFAVASMFARQNFGGELKSLVESMIVAVKEESKKTVQIDFDLLDYRSQMAATKEMDDMIHWIGINCF